MLDLSLFRNPRFTAASGSVAISFFALSGFIFLVTQYFQFLKGYGPLSTGVRLLPVAVIRRDLLDPRRPSSRSGSAPSWSSPPGCSRWPPSTSGSRPQPPPPATATIAAQMVVLGDRDGPHQRARDRGDHGRRPEGEGRRRLGGQRRHPPARRHPRRRRDRQRLRLALRQPAHRRPPRAGCRPPSPRTAHGSVGAALTVAGELAHAGHPALAAAVHNAASSAFFHGFHTANYVAAGVAAAGALMALALLPAQPTTSTDDTRDTQAPVPPAAVTAPSGL